MLLNIEQVAVRQLESAIWMYAYDFDEVAVHTIAGAAFELYTHRLGLGTFRQQAKVYIRPGKEKEFWALINRPYNFFKHGGRKDEKLKYNPESIEFILMAAAEANWMGEKIFRNESARRYRFYFMLKNPELVRETGEPNQDLRKLLEKTKDVTWDREALKFLLNNLPSPLAQ